jgi:hypothetical protein
MAVVAAASNLGSGAGMVVSIVLPEAGEPVGEGLGAPLVGSVGEVPDGAPHPTTTTQKPTTERVLIMRERAASTAPPGAASHS